MIVAINFLMSSYFPLLALQEKKNEKKITQSVKTEAERKNQTIKW